MPLEFLDNYHEGAKGEQIIRQLLRNTNHLYFQADILWHNQKDGRWYLGEVKYQEPFEPPPFWGHGLPPQQMEARLKFQEDTGIRAVLFIVDKLTGQIYWQFLDVLNAGRKYYTHGKKPRVVFPLESFNVIRPLHPAG